jgi:hypothetical protein
LRSMNPKKSFLTVIHASSAFSTRPGEEKFVYPHRKITQEKTDLLLQSSSSTTVSTQSALRTKVNRFSFNMLWSHSFIRGSIWHRPRNTLLERVAPTKGLVWNKVYNKCNSQWIQIDWIP